MALLVCGVDEERPEIATERERRSYISQAQLRACRGVSNGQQFVSRNLPWRRKCHMTPMSDAVGQPADFDQFTLNFSDLVTKLAKRSVNLVQHFKQVHIVSSFLKLAPQDGGSCGTIKLV